MNKVLLDLSTVGRLKTQQETSGSCLGLWSERSLNYLSEPCLVYGVEKKSCGDSVVLAFWVVICVPCLVYGVQKKLGW